MNRATDTKKILENVRTVRFGSDRMTVGDHIRKGRIEGEIVREDGEWAQIRLTGDHKLRYLSESARGHTDHKGEIVTVRTAMLKVA